MEFIIQLFKNYICNIWLYWFVVGIGIYFKYDNLRFSFLSTQRKIYNIILDAGIVLFLSLILEIDETQSNNKVSMLEIVGVISLLVYCFVNINSKCENETTESIFVMINGLFVTVLSFISWPTSIIVAIIIILISIVIMIYIENSAMSKFWEIIILTTESLIISGIIYFFKLNSFYDVFLIVLFTETILTMLNTGLVYLIKKRYDENAEEYLQRIKGMNNLY